MDLVKNKVNPIEDKIIETGIEEFNKSNTPPNAICNEQNVSN